MDSVNCTYDVSMQQVMAHCHAISVIVYQAGRLERNIYMFVFYSCIEWAG